MFFAYNYLHVDSISFELARGNRETVYPNTETSFDADHDRRSRQELT